MSLKQKIEQTDVAAGALAVFWLGQAGFLVKDENGQKLVIDPYLTDCGYRMKGFKRLSPKLIDPADLDVDYYITTHLHFDHFDFDAIPVVAKNSKTKFYGPISCFNEMKALSIDESRLTLLEEDVLVEEVNMRILPTYADHGELAPDAVGIFLEIGKHKLYFTGDTAYRPERIKRIASLNPDVAFLSVNGAFGNLNGEEGARVANLVGAKLAVPCHLWTFREHGGDLLQFENAMKEHAPSCDAYFMHQGECLIL